MLEKNGVIQTMLMRTQDVTCLFFIFSLLSQPFHIYATGQCSDNFYEVEVQNQSQPYTCPKEECLGGNVWGTGWYSWKSSVCQAAWHDGRILPWSNKEEERRAIWKTPFFKFETSYGTRRYGFTTEGWHGMWSGRYFTTPRLTEALYNISILVSPTSGDVRVYGGSNVRIGTDAIESGVHVNIGSRSAASAPVLISNVTTGPHIYEQYKVQDKFAAYFFTVSKKNLYSWVIIPGITFSTGDCKQDEKGYSYRGRINKTRGGIICQRWESQSPQTRTDTGEGFEKNYCRSKGRHPEPWCYTSASETRWDFCNVPTCTQDQITQRASVRDTNVTFNYKGSPRGVKWRKDGGSLFLIDDDISTWRGLQTPMIDTVNLGHGGVYMVYTEQENVRVARGVFRLIVRVCPEGKYGGLCEHNCPTCSNGGVCHDITGECICAPGFKGRHCSEACGPNRFGFDCTSQCSDDVDTGCRYRQVCTIDPYGCSCATGFKGIGCDQDCLYNYYGADCLQSCGNCLNGTCDRFRGTCKSCQDGYKMPHCKTEFARLAHSPNISRSRTEISVTWRPWSAETDHGFGPVYKYIVEYRVRTASKWTRSNDIDSTTSTFSISPTDPRHHYDIRIRVKVNDNDVGSPSPEAEACGSLAEPPRNVEVSERSSNSLKFTWQEPTCLTRTGFTPSYGYQLHRPDLPCLPKKTENESISDTYKMFDHLLPHASYSFRVRALNGVLAGPWSSWNRNVTSESAPPTPRNLSVVDMNSTFAVIAWMPPCPPNGVIREYQLKHRSLNDTGDSHSITTCTDCSSLKLLNLKTKDTYTFQIRAKTTDWGSWSIPIYKTFEEEVRDYSTSSVSLSVGVVCGSLALVVAFIVVGFAVYRKRRTMQHIAGMTENIREPAHSRRTPQSRQTALDLFTYDDVGDHPCTNNASDTCETTAHSRPTSNAYEKMDPKYWVIPFASICFGDVIGKGNFGDVQSATLVKNTSTIKVALKRLNALATDKDRLDFIGELNILSQVGSHPNIVSLIGACEHQGILFVATEYASNGNLRTFLRNSRMDSGYANTGFTTSLSEKQLLQMALDVSRGMKHLAACKIIHRDLAARNVLLSEDLTSKISDFGLSRKEDIYVKHTQTRVPIRWMAPESLFEQSYTTKSDVWSFGILMWEIVTLGGTPYSGASSSHLLAKLQSGYRMPQPCNCSEDVYDLMTMCWREVPHKRPSFNVLAPMLEDMLTLRKTFISVKCGDDFMYEVIDSGKDDC